MTLKEQVCGVAVELRAYVDALSILSQALSLTQENRLTTDIAEEIMTIKLGALDAYVAALIALADAVALDNLSRFDSSKNMAVTVLTSARPDALLKLAENHPC